MDEHKMKKSLIILKIFSSSKNELFSKDLDLYTVSIEPAHHELEIE
jgi:hypothetical protein